MKHDWIKLKRHTFVSCRRCHAVGTRSNEKRDNCPGWNFPPTFLTIGTYRYIREDVAQEVLNDKA